MSQRASRILLVDDDPGIRALVSAFLGREGFEVTAVDSTPPMWEALTRASGEGRPIDLVILDLMLPGEGGLQALRRLRADAEAPAVLVLSAMGSVADRVEGLELGADDYLPKPCNPRELLARVRAVLRRRTAGGRREALGLSVSFAGFRLDRIRRELVSPGGVSVSLSEGEFLLLNHFIEHPGEVLSRETLLELSGQSDNGDRAIDVQVSRLRRKLACDSPAGADLIRTVRNGGYMMKAEVRPL
ncbi:MAG: response regulator transcription factor [Sphingomonadaceae bacterium]|uniref:response regulator transcription factor n=1 Tax=Thermaurantiacus sp. TaxID=2820283 RepID=UPI00298EE0E4|nr:response regulator transcription factor [Thermaurantiacus sp.]MCS6987107.1 response regulator transcription factor [Sphingomonadaceae bacterium]MDW8415555.1 response regulator transcription factor [Thermaurantiacus sp.]